MTTPELYDPWGSLARTQGLIAMVEGTITDDGAGAVTIAGGLGGGGIVVMSPISGAYIRVANGTYNLGAWGALAVKIPPTSADDAAVVPEVIAWTDTPRQYDHRDYIILGCRVNAGRVGWAFPSLQNAADKVMTLIRSLVLSVNGVIDIQGLDQKFKTLKLFASLRSAGQTGSFNVESLYVGFNGDTVGANYFGEFLQGNAGNVAAVGPVSASLGNIGIVSGNLNGSNEFSSLELTIPDYSNTARRKTCHAISGNGGGPASAMYLRVGTAEWSSAAAISRIQLANDTGNLFSAGSRVDIYGLPA